MKTKRRQARELVLKLLYQIDTTKVSATEALNTYLESLANENEHKHKCVISAEVRTFAKELLFGTVEHLDKIDALIAQLSEHWRLERMAVIDRNILRFSAYEILYREDIPVNVAIDEAVEVAKKYSSVDSSRFINGILDRLAAYIGRKTSIP